MELGSSDTSTGKLLILGAGNWGTTLASLYAPARPTVLVARTPQSAESLAATRVNERYLPDVSLPDSLIITSCDQIEIDKDDLLLIAVPSHSVRSAVAPLASKLSGAVVVNASKGFEHLTLRTMSEVLIELLPETDVVTLSGPNIAREISAGLPTRAVLAGKRLGALSRAAEMLEHPNLVFETSRDLKGVELVGSLKGILAIAIGLADGMEMGDNFTGLLVTYGLREFAQLATFMGARDETVYSIAGLGDMVTSSLSSAGRNRRFGKLLAAGRTPEEALSEVGMVVEGVEMLRTVSRLERLNLTLPLFSTVRDIVEGQCRDPKHILVETVLHYGSPGHSSTKGERRRTATADTTAG